MWLYLGVRRVGVRRCSGRGPGVCAIPSIERMFCNGNFGPVKLVQGK